MCCRQERLEIVQRSVERMHGPVVGNVVAVVPQRGRKERHQPDRGYPEVAEVVEFLRQALEVSNAISVAVKERTYVYLINDRVFIPKRFAGFGQEVLQISFSISVAERRFGGSLCFPSSHGKKDYRPEPPEKLSSAPLLPKVKASQTRGQLSIYSLVRNQYVEAFAHASRRYQML